MVEIGSRLDQMIADEEQRFLERSPRAVAAHREASVHLAGGVASSLQVTEPSPVWASHGKGSRLTDLDGNEYVDLNNGYGALVVGHAHPEVVAAVEERLNRGSHFAQPTTEVAEVAGELSDSFRATAVAVWQLGYRGDHGRRPPDEGAHRSGPHRQGRGCLPRPPRHRAGRAGGARCDGHSLSKCAGTTPTTWIGSSSSTGTESPGCWSSRS